MRTFSPILISPLFRSLRSYWTQQKITATFLFYGETSKITGGKLYNQVTGRTAEYLTVGGSAGAETYQCPHTSDYSTADTDAIWVKTDKTTWRTTATAELIAYDLQRTPVKYDNASPGTIRIIGILKSGVTVSGVALTELYKSFDLPIEWQNSTNGNGHIKFNRTGQNLWVPESVVPTMSYANPGGSGDRHLIINVTKSSDLVTVEGYSPCMPALIDGHLIADYASYTSFVGGNPAGKWLNFDFGSGARKYISETKFYLGSGYAYEQGTWKWQGSNEESVTPSSGSFVDLDSGHIVGIVGAPYIQTDTSLSANVLGFRHYRLLGISGYLNANSVWWEFEFKIGSL